MFKSRALLIVMLTVMVVMAVAPVMAQDSGSMYTVGLSESEELGPFLVDGNGMTLYLFDADTIGTSNCYDRCAEAWPPLLVESADELTKDPAIPGDLGTTERTDGTLQVTYNGLPLYYWFRDAAAGDTTGHRVGRVWWVVAPATVYAWGNADLGTFLVGPNGMTLYMFKNDQPGISNCYDQCATNWPPLLAESADAVVPGVNLLGEVGTAERTDGTIQVTYNGMPLYYWKDDVNLGDATGENVGEVWFTVVPEVAGVATSAELGDYMVSYDGMTLYTFANDTAGVSTCFDTCAENWPPFIVPANLRLNASGFDGAWGTLDRGEGVLQLTYNGLPLYFWKDDKAPGDTLGNNVGEVWFIVQP